MADVEVTCISRQPRDNPHEGITHLGNAHATWTCQQFISWIDREEYTFFIVVNGQRSNIGVVKGPNGKYLRAHIDGEWNDSLLALSECP